jgi:hypothetical protein
MNNNEHLAQTLLIKWFRLQYPLMAKCLWAIPNGGARHIGTAIKLKQEGVTAGVADLFLMIPANGLHGLFIEMKADKSARLQQNQEQFLNLAESMGYGAEVAYGFEEGQKIIQKYLRES